MNHSSNNSLMLLIFQHKHLIGTKIQPTNQISQYILGTYGFLQSSLALLHIESDYVNKVMSKDIYTMIDTYGSSKGRNQGRFTQEGQLLSDFPDAKLLDCAAVQYSNVYINETIGKLKIPSLICKSSLGEIDIFSSHLLVKYYNVLCDVIASPDFG